MWEDVLRKRVIFRLGFRRWVFLDVGMIQLLVGEAEMALAVMVSKASAQSNTLNGIISETAHCQAKSNGESFKKLQSKTESNSWKYGY